MISISYENSLLTRYQFDFIFSDGAMYKHGNMGQGIYIDPERDFVAVYFSATPYVAPYGEIKAPAYFRAAAKILSPK
jgi:CubicO group peptidase (beta-lactamase class C family)